MPTNKKKILDDGMEVPEGNGKNNEKEKSDLLKNFKDQLPYLIAAINIQARYTKMSYDAFVSAGFSAAEALELCKAVVSGSGGKK